jgi:hypothetical protein
MTAKERVACAFEFRPYDRVPIYQAGFSATMASQILGRPAYVGGGHAQYLESLARWNGEDAHQEYLARAWQDPVELCRKLELDVVRTSYWRLGQTPTARLDEYTFRFGEEGGTWRVMRYDPQTELYQIIAENPRPEPTLESLEVEVAALEASVEGWEPSPSSLDGVKRTMQEFGEDGVPYGMGAVALGIPRDQIWLEAIALRPDLVKRYLDACAEQAVRSAAMAGREGIRYLYGGGDFASNHGPFYSPRSFHELMLPGLQRISEACHAAGSLHGFASDGNLWPVAEDLFGASGVNFYYEIDALAGMSLRRLRETFPHLTLMGGINSATLHRGSLEDVVAETRTALEVAKEYGGCIVGCSNQIVAGTPLANFWGMMETLWAER